MSEMADTHVITAFPFTRGGISLWSSFNSSLVIVSMISSLSFMNFSSMSFIRYKID